QQAVDWILEGMAPLGAEYVEPLRRGLLEQRWVDVYPNRGKRDGAFCSHAYGCTPQVMMSYVGDLGSLSTLAHELGHAMHDVLMDEAQPLPYTDVSMVAAETASNFNQALVRRHLLARFTDPDQRLDVLDEAFGNFHRYFFIMPTLVRFELAVHDAVARGEGLTGAKLNALMRDLFQEGYGEHITADERVGITWAEFGHLYVPFYTFQYAAGISAAAPLAADVDQAEPGASAPSRCSRVTWPSSSAWRVPGDGGPRTPSPRAGGRAGRRQRRRQGARRAGDGAPGTAPAVGRARAHRQLP